MRDGDQALSLLYFLGCLVLAGSALAVRRAPLGQTLKMILAWALIFAAGFAAFALRNDFRALGGRIMAEASGEADQQPDGRALRIRRSDDGHFWVNAQLNGRSVRFLVDSGATVTTITTETARAAGVESSGGFGVLVDTANGTATVERGRAGRLVVGPIARTDLAVYISATAGDTNVIGMNFLSSLSGWGVEGSTLVLRP